MSFMTGHGRPGGTRGRSAPTRFAFAAFAAFAAAALAGCQGAGGDNRSSGLFEPYRIDVPQGNYIDQSTFDKVRPGMTREQVRFVLGSPLLVDAFHPDRWDYVFRFQFPNGKSIARRAVVFFKEGRVERVEADALPARDDPSDPALPGYRRSRQAAGAA